MKKSTLFLLQGVAAAVALVAVGAQAKEMRFPVNNPQSVEGQFVHVPPTMEELETADMHPELKRVIRRGHDLFMNTDRKSTV